VRRADDLTVFTWRLSKNFGNLKLLVPYGPVRACNGVVYLFNLKFIFIYTISYVLKFENPTNFEIKRITLEHYNKKSVGERCGM
jgi:hypothetical protein